MKNMSEEQPFEMEKLLDLRDVAERSYNGQEIPPYELSLFAEEMIDEEKSKRFYDAKVGTLVGKLLLTDKKIIFIGKKDKERVVATIDPDSIIGVEINVDRDDKALASLLIFAEDEESGLQYEFIMSRFGLERLADEIKMLSIN